MNDTTNRQAIQREETTSNTVNAAVLEPSNASTSAAACSNHNQAVLSSSLVQQNLADEEEQVVTSTSNENSGNTPHHPVSDFPHLDLHRFITSPARITSSTGNDCSSSPIQPLQSREETANLLLSSEDDSLEQQQASATLTKAQEFQKHRLSQQRESINFNVGMPTTSSAAAASSAIVSSDETSCNYLASTRRQDTLERRGVNSSDRNNGKLVRSSSIESQAIDVTRANMVARDSGNNLEGTGTSSASDPSDNHVEKIILKLPKPHLPPNSNESQHLQYHTRHQQQRREHEHLLDNDPSMSNSCSNSSTNSSITVEADTRKVEPLKINLHHGTHQHHLQHHNPSSSGSSSSSTADVPHVIPKITIKPLFKKSSEGTAFENMNSNSNATEGQLKQSDPIPKLTIKAAGSNCTIGENITNEPHIVPKLTIRAAHEERGCTHTSVVPKLTIKISDTQSPHGLHNSINSPPNAKLLSIGTNEHVQQPPLPKLTIKTTLDGASGSSIMSSSISPASSSSNSSSSAASSSQSVVSSPMGSATAAVLNMSSVPRLTIKTISKNSDESQPIVPKLTIKTSASGSCVSKAESPISEVTADADMSGGGSSCGNKIPKLTIKTGQEHAVIISQHKTDQTIPKLTIKTKSIDLDDVQTDLNKEYLPPEKIPKLTIKAQSAEAVTPIPKLTISTPHSPKSNSASLVVRQVAAVASPTSSSKTHSPDRLPKLMISRQDITVNYSTENLAEKTVPKLTIKTTPSISDQNEEPAKIPKLTIKTLPPPLKETTPLSEDSEDGTSVESGQSPIENEVQQSTTNKIVPKLTITNLGSPKLKLKKTSSSTIDKLPSETTSFGNKKSLRSSTQIHLTEQNQPKNDEKPTNVVANGGECSNSQEFCGFTENTSDSQIAGSQPQPSNANRNNQIDIKSTAEEVPEVRRSSDDMDIDEGLQEHDPKIFKNITHFGAIRNGESYGIHLDNNLENLSQISLPNKTLPSEIVDTVDLTSSPSPGSSPAHFNYTDADPKLPDFLNATCQSNVTANALLLECLQRENSVIQTAPRIATTNADVRPQVIAPKEKSNSLLLSQLTAPLRYPPPPPLQPRPLPHLFNAAQSGLKYPQFTDRLMANGAHSGLQQQLTTQQATLPSSFSTASLVPPMHFSHPMITTTKPPATVIDSIEILDTPEGSPRSSQDDSHSVGEFPNHLEKSVQHLYMDKGAGNEAADGQLRHNNNTMHHMTESLDINHSSLLKRSSKDLAGLTNDCGTTPPNKLRRTESLTPTMATLTIFTSDNVTNSATIITTSPTLISGSGDGNCSQSPKPQFQNSSPNTIAPTPVQHPTTHHHRSRKQKHENLLDVTMDEVDQLNIETKSVPKQNANCIKPSSGAILTVNTPQVATPAPRKRGRPRRIRPEEQQLELPTQNSPVVSTPTTPNLTNCSAAERRVQLLRKRLAIDMVSAEQPVKIVEEKVDNSELASPLEDINMRRERAMRTTRRCGTPNSMNAEKQATSAIKQRKQRLTNVGVANNCEIAGTSVTAFNHFGGSNSSLSSACSSNSSYPTTVTTTATASTAFMGPSNSTTLGPINCSLSMSSQIDLTMSSSSSTCSNSTTATLTTVEAGGKAMLPPIKALSSTNPLPDVVFQSKDFSAIMLTQQLTSMQSSPSSRKGSRANSHDGDIVGSFGSGSGDDSTSVTPPMRTPGRGRGRGRGRGFRGGPRAHRLGRGASAVAKAIAMNRPRCVGGLKHTPDPERMKGLFTPSPQVFEEDTRMSADMSQTQMNSEPQTPIRHPDFFTNEEESQSSVISNTSVSILDPNTVAAVQNGASVKRLKKKKMEVCAADEREYTVASIAEYDWPPPKGCCPSKNRDTFMIQEQVANFLGIKSFKRKYPDLPRRQIDMEERNWLQEKGLVSEKMCDLGITAVWASDILDIMYADFYEKYEEYKDFVRQKHLREIEAKQKSLGLNVSGRGLQARDRAMLSTSKWNAYFNKTRKEERPRCLDLQSLMVNVPLPLNVPATNIMNRSIADEIAKAANVERIAEPPTLLKPHNSEQSFEPSSYYPIAVVPGQYSSNFKRYSHYELRALPMNTVINGPLWNETDPTTTAEDTDSVSETYENKESTTKRLKIRRSRRERSERSSKQKCDIKSEPRPLSRQSETIRLSIEDGASYSESATESCSETSGSSLSSSSSTETSSSGSSSDESEEEATNKCSVCQRKQNRNLKDVPELFINCYTCRRKVHPSCIEMPHRMALRVRNYNWQCADCKCCIKCKRKQEPNKMLFCEQCDRGYHIYCLGVKTIPDGRWSCERCSFCIRCGATKPEGLPQQLCSPNGEKIKQIKHKKVKWINEYRLDHITKLREHCSMLCVPCGRSRTSAKRVQISTGNNSHNIQGNISRNSSATSGFSSTTQQHSPQLKSQYPSGIPPTNTNITSTNGTLTSSTVSGAIVSSNSTSNVASIESTSPSPPPVVA